MTLVNATVELKYLHNNLFSLWRPFKEANRIAKYGDSA